MTAAEMRRAHYCAELVRCACWPCLVTVEHESPVSVELEVIRETLPPLTVRWSASELFPDAPGQWALFDHKGEPLIACRDDDDVRFVLVRRCNPRTEKTQ